MAKDNNEKNDIKPYVITGYIASAICLGIGFIVGRKYEYENDQHIWKSILQEAYDNGSTKLYWELNDGSQTLDFVVSFVDAHIHNR